MTLLMMLTALWTANCQAGIRVLVPASENTEQKAGSSSGQKESQDTNKSTQKNTGKQNINSESSAFSSAESAVESSMESWAESFVESVLQETESAVSSEEVSTEESQNRVQEEESFESSETTVSEMELSSESTIEESPENAELTVQSSAENLSAEDVISGVEESEEVRRVTLAFAGDINFDEEWATTQYMDAQENGIYDVLSAELISYMQSADIFMLNNEFTYSTRGEQIEKTYHFRADPSRVNLLKELGVDIVLLANNHVFDYGEEALLDTLETLESAEIPYVGAGRNIGEAASPYYFEMYGRTIAYVAATEGEQYEASIHTQAATEEQPGVLECYDPERFLEAIREAAASSDFVVASVHWGMEYDENYRDDQLELAQQMAEAGADAIIGTHPHCLEGIGLIGDVPVFYSLGNFWFNDKDLYTGMAELVLEIPSDPDEPVKLAQTKFLPCTQYGLETALVTDETEKKTICDYLTSISRGDVVIDAEGNVIDAA